MSEQYFLRHVEDHVGVLTLNRADKHNAMNDEMQDTMPAMLQSFIDDSDVRAILIRAAGKSFCAGRDTNVLGHRARNESDFEFVRRAQDFRMMTIDCRKPIIAAVRGAAIGGGFELALSADMRVFSKTAKVSLPEIVYGLVPDTGGTQFLTALIGPSLTKYLVMTGDALTGERAHELGICDWLVEDDELDAKAMEIARKVASGPPQALAMAKQLVDNAWIDTYRNGLRQELLAISTLFRSDDYAEARTALREKRKPTYTGR
ncbi:MAG: enoyl-CoA hydratase/isomerase family protein [Spongiibacteraceae bacterium]